MIPTDGPDRCITWVATADLDALMALFPHFTCPFCGRTTIASPAAIKASAPSLKEIKAHLIEVEAYDIYAEILASRRNPRDICFSCRPCYQWLWYDPQTGEVYPAATDTRKGEEIAPQYGEEIETGVLQ